MAPHLTHAFSYEALEQASYELLLRGSRARGGHGHRRCRTQIRDQERAMASRFPGGRERAADLSLEAVGREDVEKQLTKYLADAHALEAQSIKLLETGLKKGGEPKLRGLYADHLDESQGQQRMLEERLGAPGGSPSAIKDAAMRLGALNWGMFFQAPAGKLGWALLSEELTATIIVAALVILVSVVFILRRAHPRAPRQATLTTTLSFSSRRPPAEAAPCSCSNARRC